MKLTVYKILTGLSLILAAAAFDLVVAQSVNIDAPTPVSASTIRGKIAARDIGDPRATAHYYVFEAAAGDVFLKIEASNLEGDIDVFYADNLRPVTRINLYADGASLSTAREVYLRKAEKLILKIEAKTPTDDPGTYSIKFEGSWIAMAPAKDAGISELPKAVASSDAEVRVNSVGTIIEVKPKPTPTPTPKTATVAVLKPKETTQTPAPVSTVPKPKPSSTSKPAQTRPKLVVTDDLAKSEEVKPKETAVKPKPTPKTQPKATAKAAKKTPVETPKPETAKPNPAAELAEKLESLRLIVEFTDGRKIERPMNKVVRFGVDKGILTIVSTEGSIGRYSIVDVLKISIE